MRTLTPEEHEQELALARHGGRTERGERVRVLATRGVRTFPGHLETCQNRCDRGCPWWPAFYALRRHVHELTKAAAKHLRVSCQDFNRALIYDYGFPWRQSCGLDDLFDLADFLSGFEPMIAKRKRLTDKDRGQHGCQGESGRDREG